jgi:hypothetical protein
MPYTNNGYLTGLSNFRRCSKMVLTPVWKTGGWRKLAGVQFLLLLPYLIDLPGVVE